MLTAVHHTLEPREYCVKSTQTQGTKNVSMTKQNQAPKSTNDPQLLKPFYVFGMFKNVLKSKSQKSHSKVNSKIYPGTKHLSKINKAI